MRGRVSAGRVAKLNSFTKLPVTQLVQSITDRSPVGECLFASGEVPGNVYIQNFTVPPGVRRISFLGITAGTMYTAETVNGTTTGYHGFPGALGYKNNIPVTPGEVLTLHVISMTSGVNPAARACYVRNSKGLTIFNVQSSASVVVDRTLDGIFRSPALRTCGAPGYLGPGTSGDVAEPTTGASAAYGGTAPYGIGKDGSVPLGNRNGSQDNPSWPVFGACNAYGWEVARGCLRLIWGPGRTFPFNARPI